MNQTAIGIRLDSATVDFPIYGVREGSFKGL